MLILHSCEIFKVSWMLSLISQLLKGERASCYGKVIKFSNKRPVV